MDKREKHHRRKDTFVIVDRQVGNEEMAKTSLSTEPEWEDPVQLSCDTGDQVQAHF